jgi:hypothetical protein
MLTMRKAWISSLAVGAVLAVAPASRAVAQNPNNELFLQSFMSTGVSSLLTSIFASDVSYGAGTGFDIRQFNGSSLIGPSLFYQVAATAHTGAFSLATNVALAANTMYAIVIELAGPVNGSVDNAYAPGSVFVRANATSAWTNQNYDVAGFGITTKAITSTPEPASLALMATGFVGLGGVGFRRRNRRNNA